jgi:Ni,Fe-hydrogenase I large subunit
MSTKIVIDPVTRIEGHLKVEVEIEGEEENRKVVSAKSCGEMFRGWELILKGRNPLDAQQLTQRICGVCPAGHAQASTLTLDNAFGVTPPTNGRIIRNLILGSNYIQSHILHFYHLAALDYVDITAILKYQGKDPGLNYIKDWAKSEIDQKVPGPVSPFLPRYEGDYIEDVELNITLIAHYVQALKMRRKAQEMLAIWGGKMPHEISVLPGGVTEKPTVDKIASYIWRLKELQMFIDKIYVPDVITVAKAYPAYFNIGKGCGNLLSYGVFPENTTGTKKLLASGVYINGKAEKFDSDEITEHVKYSKYSSASKRHPSKGETTPDLKKKEAYSWLKSPRYKGKVVEVGPLARMAVTHLTKKNPEVSKLITSTLAELDNAPISALFSVLGRHAARALECKLVAKRCGEWITMLDPNKPVHKEFSIPDQAEGEGLTEAPRGALGHWISISGKVIKNYQCVVPTTWNLSPRDDTDQMGPLEQALVGTPVKDPDNPIEIVRVIRSFDPCIACAVHILEPGKQVRKFRVV